MTKRDEYSQAYQTGFTRTVRFLRAKGVPNEVSQDVAQTAWTRGWEKLPQLRNDHMILTWVNSIALNTYRNKLRKEPIFEALPQLGAPNDTSSAIDAERVLKLARPCDRSLIERQMEGATTKELAIQEGVTETAMRLRLLRARRRLYTRIVNRSLYDRAGLAFIQPARHPPQVI